MCSWVISKYGRVQYQKSRALLFNVVDNLHYDTVMCIAIARIVEEYLLKVANMDGVNNMEIGLTIGMFSVHHNGNCILVEIDNEICNKPLAVFELSVHKWEDKFNARNPEAPTVEQIIFVLSSMLKFHVKDTNTKKLYEVSLLHWYLVTKVISLMLLLMEVISVLSHSLIIVSFVSVLVRFSRPSDKL